MYALLSVIVALLFIRIAVSHVYAPGTAALRRLLDAVLLGGSDVHLPFGLRLSLVLRKLYSLVAFTIVGVCIASAMTNRRRRLLYATIGVAGMSTVIEVLQKTVLHSRESFASNCVDVLLGGAGGWLGAWLRNRFR